MASTPTKVYPLRDRTAPGVPHVVTEAPSKAEAEALEATGAFTTNATHPDRIPDAEIPLPVDAPTHVVTRDGVVPIEEAEPAAATSATPAGESAPADAGKGA